MKLIALSKISLFLFLSISINGFGQHLPDSVIKRNGIRSIARHSYKKGLDKPVSKIVIEYFDTNARLVMKTNCYNPSKPITSRYLYTYDEKGDRVEMSHTTYDKNRDSTTKIHKYKFNDHGQLSENYRGAFEYQYNATGQVIEKLEPNDDVVKKTAYVYSGTTLIKREEFRDSIKWLQVDFEYNDSGQLIRRVHKRNFSDPENAEKETEYTFVYDENGLVVIEYKTLIKTDSPYSGSFLNFKKTYKYVYTFH